MGTDDALDLPALLRQARAKLGLSQQEVAAELGVTQAAISGWETGDCVPESVRLRGIARVYRLPVEQVVPAELVAVAS